MQLFALSSRTLFYFYKKIIRKDSHFQIFVKPLSIVCVYSNRFLFFLLLTQVVFSSTIYQNNNFVFHNWGKAVGSIFPTFVPVVVYSIKLVLAIFSLNVLIASILVRVKHIWRSTLIEYTRRMLEIQVQIVRLVKFSLIQMYQEL